MSIPASRKFLFGLLLAALALAGGVPQARAGIPVTEDNPSVVSAIIGNAVTNATLLASFGDPASSALLTGLGKALVAGCAISGEAARGDKFFSELSKYLGSNLAAIAGSPFESANLGKQIALLQAQDECFDAQKKNLEAQSAGALATFRGQEQYYDNLKVIQNAQDATKAQIGQLLNRQAASLKDVLKAFAIRMTLNLNKSLTTSLVNKLVAKYKIPDFGQYGRILAGQVYAMDYIKNNYQGDEAQKAIVASLVNVKFNNQPKMLAAAENLIAAQAAKKSTDLSKTKLADKDFYVKLANLGNANADKNYLTSVYNQIADGVYAEASRAADQEVKTGRGFNSVRDCSGVVSSRARAESQLLALADQRERAEAAYKKLAATPNVKPEEFAKAKQALDKVNEQMVNLPAGNSDLLVKTCSALTNPGSAVANEIDSLLKQHLEQATNLKSDNLPFYANFLSGVASNLVNNIITGKDIKSGLLSEFGLGGLQLGVNDLAKAAVEQYEKDKDKGQGGLASGVTPGLTHTPEYLKPGDKFTFRANFQTHGTAVPTSLAIRPSAADSNILVFKSLSTAEADKGDFTFEAIAPPTTTKYVLEVFDESKKLLGSSEETVTVDSAAFENCGGDGSCVQGAFTFRPIQPRGPALPYGRR